MKHKNQHDVDLQDDIANIKAALFTAAKDFKGKATETFNQSFENMRSKSTDLQENVSSYIAERPLKAVGIALLSGWILGLMTNKKRNSKRH